MLLRYLFIAAALLYVFPGFACATHIHYEYDAVGLPSFPIANIGQPWIYTFELTQDDMLLWDVDTTTLLPDGSYDRNNIDFYGSYDTSLALHYVTLRIEPNRYPPQGSDTSNYVELRVNDILISNWGNPIELYDWGVPGGSLSDEYGIKASGFEVKVELTGLSNLSNLAASKLPLDITNVNIEGCFGPAALVPEPSTLLLLGSGILGLAVWSRRKR